MEPAVKPDAAANQHEVVKDLVAAGFPYARRGGPGVKGLVPMVDTENGKRRPYGPAQKSSPHLKNQKTTAAATMVITRMTGARIT